MSRATLLLSVTLLLPAAGNAGQNPADPVVADVVRMLDAKVEEPVILAFLDGSARRPAPLSPDEIIALTRAGASAVLVERLVRMAQASAPAPAPPEPPAEAPQAASPQASPAPAPRPASPPRPEAPAPAVEGNEGFVALDLRFMADKEGLDEPWELFYYVDGRPLAWSTGRGGLIGSDSIRNEERLEAGEHVMALLLERHDPRHERHEAIVCPEVVRFSVSPGGRHRLEVTVRESWALPLRGGGALSYSFTDAAGETSRRDELGGDPDDWPHLCEDSEASVSGGRKPSRTLRREIEGCRRWADLWAAGAPTREEVRGMLARLDFRPVPAAAR